MGLCWASISSFDHRDGACVSFCKRDCGLFHSNGYKKLFVFFNATCLQTVVPFQHFGVQSWKAFLLAVNCPSGRRMTLVECYSQI